MGQRLVAVLVDVAIVVALWGLFGIASGMAGWTAPEDDTALTWAVTLSMVVYFSVFQTRWRRTPGKALLGLAVEPDHPEGMGWPGRVVLRELLGRVLNQFFFGAGYWVAFFHPHRQSWGDRMAGTVVLRRPAPRWLRRTGMIGGVGALVTGALVVLMARWADDIDRTDAVVDPQVDAAAAAITASRSRIDTLMTRFADGTEAYGADMEAALDEVDRFERQARLGLELTRRSRGSRPVLFPGARRQYDYAERLWQLCLEEAAAWRRQAKLGLAQNAAGVPSGLLAYRMALCGSDVAAVQKRIRALDEGSAGP
jgi:uncharacterized RDD family membrane protein YckC